MSRCFQALKWVGRSLRACLKKRRFKQSCFLGLILFILNWNFFLFLFFMGFQKNLPAPLRHFAHFYRNYGGEFRRRHSPEFAHNLQWMAQKQAEDWVIELEEQIKLHAQFFRNKANPQGENVVILAHGHRGSPFRLAHFVQFYYETLGYHVLCPVARAHGSSDGEIISFGWREKEDVLRWSEALIQELGIKTHITLHGVSMGGATVLMAAPSMEKKQLKAVISDCSFSSLRGSFFYQLSHLPHWYVEMLWKKLNQRTEKTHGFKLSEINVVDFAKKIEVPVLLVHGEEDSITPAFMAFEIYEGISVKDKKILSVPTAKHADAWFVAQASYADAIREILQSSS